ncbi:hypothetical protein [Aureibacter tunicatorum]|uniref:Uncharacterized protein n=1 Tax=Aureibacter tunicatorum TaxID=866807 RepID=A0AAE3XI37_9BACT|nr:hypothetical protein [Aureibacter tunicatorum]MDR6237212.1 hypothetical protein [Aureibacter tunicatorum]BDD06204.1 hypothetical protein AUTU_36870 [Aureibacter tunicatorum]
MILEKKKDQNFLNNKIEKKVFVLLLSYINYCHGTTKHEKEIINKVCYHYGLTNELRLTEKYFECYGDYLIEKRIFKILDSSTYIKKNNKLQILVAIWNISFKKGHITPFEFQSIKKIASTWKVEKHFNRILCLLSYHYN